MYATLFLRTLVHAGFYHAGRSLAEIFCKHKFYIAADMNGKEAWEMQSELVPQMVEILGIHGGHLLSEVSFFSSSRDTKDTTKSVSSRERTCV